MQKSFVKTVLFLGIYTMVLGTVVATPGDENDPRWQDFCDWIHRGAINSLEQQVKQRSKDPDNPHVGISESERQYQVSTLPSYIQKVKHSTIAQGNEYSNRVLNAFIELQRYQQTPQSEEPDKQPVAWWTEVKLYSGPVTLSPLHRTLEVKMEHIDKTNTLFTKYTILEIIVEEQPHPTYTYDRPVNRIYVQLFHNPTPEMLRPAF